jgi:hypothetical protein
VTVTQEPDRLTFTRGGVRVTVTGVKQRRVWREEEHPRDREGRWIETGAEVRVWGGGTGRVLRNVGGGRVEVERPDGRRDILHRNYLTVTARPDGSAPTSERRDDIGVLPETEASPGAVAAPTPGARPAPVDEGGLDDALADADPDLAERVRDAAAAYQAAVGNGVDDDEADERANLLAALDDVDARHAGDPRVREQSRLVRAAATQ